MNSFGILRTNVGLTTNVKLMVGSTYSLFLDSIESSPELSDSKYKKLQFSKTNYWDELVPYFFNNTPADVAYKIKYDNDNDNMSTDFSKQYDDLYNYGARNIVDNKDYEEEYEYFAPLYISKSELPTNFIIFRIDGPGLNIINKDNFSSEIINKLKCVKNFDLTRTSPLGEWLETNVTKNKSFPISPFYMDFRGLEFSSWNGLDFEDGGYSERAFMLDSTLLYENTFHDFEKMIFDGFKKNKIIFPHIINFSFLFDDTPATPNSIRKWSLNRYLGFYLDQLELVKYVSPYDIPKLKSDVVIDQNNILYSLESTDPFSETWKTNDFPYVEIGGEFYKIEKYIETQHQAVRRVMISSTSYVDRFVYPTITKYKIISNTSLEGRQLDINKNLISITSGTSSNTNRLSYSDGSTFDIDGFDDADVWIINIDNMYHNIVKGTDGEFYIQTDYAFSQSISKFDYYINDPDPSYRKSIDLKVDSQTPPKKFGIYRCKFSDIKDFDTDIVETGFSKHEYIKKDQLTLTDETKMYAVNHESTSFPKDVNDYKINNSVVNIPAASEYTANGETFRLVNDDLGNGNNSLSTIWRKNSERVKWGFQNSISSNDYSYLLNNSFAAEDYNRTTNTHDPEPNRHERNLDYFLSINPSTSSYIHHSLHVVDNSVITFEDNGFNGTLMLQNVSDIGAFEIGDVVLIDQYPGFVYSAYNATASVTLTGYQHDFGNYIVVSLPFLGNTPGGTILNQTRSRSSFELDRYLGVSRPSVYSSDKYNYDYFSYFFGKKTEFDSGNVLSNTKKWSYFNAGDNSIPNITLFRGIKFKLYDVDGVKITNGNIDTVNIKSSNKYDGYKFDILFSRNTFDVNSTPGNLNVATVSYTNNQMGWDIINDWKHDQVYDSGVIVRWNDILYQSSTQSQIADPLINPNTSSDWGLYATPSIFWSPSMNGTDTTINNNMYYGFTSSVYPPLVYNSGDYYYSTGGPGNNFWDPSLVYATGSVVLYKNQVWLSVDTTSLEPGSQNSNWEMSTSNTIWSPVELWRSDFDYTIISSWDPIFGTGSYVVYDDVVYAMKVGTTIGLTPKLDTTNWNRIYSMVPDTSIVYKNGLRNNNIIHMNNRLYMCVSNTNSDTLDNGINIYINNKFKNVLVNIYVNDNTYDKISNVDRDDLYSDLYSKLTANNFMNAINDLSNKYDFSDNIRYIIINENLSINIYDFNNFNSILSLPVLLTCESPDQFITRIHSNSTKPVSLAHSEIKPKRKLDNGNITSLDQLNYYSETHLSTSINRKIDDPAKIPNYSGLVNNIYNYMYRHSGYYSPIFNDIELFEAPGLTQGFGNYKFDTSLTYFGKIKERVVSKVNRYRNILKLRNNANIKSIYPMLDEYGYHTTDFFIFKSTWDFEYHIECVDVPQVSTTAANQSLISAQVDNNTNTNNLSQL